MRFVFLCRAVAVSALIGFSCSADAASYITNVMITEISVNRQLGNIAFVRLAQAPPGAPACSSNAYWHYTVPLDDAIGKNIYPILIAALMANKLVTIGGVGACQEYGNVESLAALNPIG